MTKNTTSGLCEDGDARLECVSILIHYYVTGFVANPTVRQFDRASRRFIAIPN